MEKILDSFKLMVKKFPSNFLFFSAILNLLVWIFTVIRFSTYMNYFDKVASHWGLGSLSLFWPMTFELGLFSFFGMWSFFLRNCSFKEINIFKLIFSIMIIIAAYFILYVSILCIWGPEEKISNYCDNYSFCKEKGAQEDEFIKQSDGSILTMHSTCPQEFNSICGF